MKIKEVLSLEKENDCYIYLIKEGIFWRAYNSSAFLLTRYVRELKITKKYYKVVAQELVYVGFPNSIITKILQKANLLFEEKERGERQLKLKIRAESKQIVPVAYKGMSTRSF